MMKKRYSVCLDENTMALIDAAASSNKMSRSAVVRMFLDLVGYLPGESLKMSSPVPALLGITKEANYARGN